MNRDDSSSFSSSSFHSYPLPPPGIPGPFPQLDDDDLSLNGRGLLWEISDGSGRPPSYLFGVFPSSHPMALKALDDRMRYLNPPTRTVMVEYGDFQNPSAELYKAWFPLWKFGEAPPTELAGVAVKKRTMLQRLLDIAASRGMQIELLENGGEHNEFFRRISPQEASCLSEAVFRNETEYDRRFRHSILYYLDGDIMGLYHYNIENFPRLSGNLQRRHLHESIFRRNYNMLSRATGFLQRGGVFIAVGVFNLPGSRGMVELLRSMGYTCSAIDPYLY